MLLVGMNTASASPSHQQQTKTVNWVMADPNGSASNITYPQYLEGTDKAPTCGHTVQTDVYKYDKQHKQAVDDLIASGVLNQGGDYAFVISWSFSSQDACVTPPTKVTLCHATPPATAKNGWNEITVSTDSVVKKNGHDSHAADIIPSFDYTDKSGDHTYPGKNLGTVFSGSTGQQVLDNGCQLPPPPPTEVTPAGVTFVNATCGNPTHGSYTVTPTNGVVYKDSDSNVVTGTNDVTVPGSADIKAYPADSHTVLTGTTEWTHTFVAPTGCTTTPPESGGTVTANAVCKTNGSYAVTASVTGLTGRDGNYLPNGVQVAVTDGVSKVLSDYVGTTNNHGDASFPAFNYAHAPGSVTLEIDSKSSSNGVSVPFSLSLAVCSSNTTPPVTHTTPPVHHTTPAPPTHTKSTTPPVHHSTTPAPVPSWTGGQNPPAETGANGPVVPGIPTWEIEIGIGALLVLAGGAGFAASRRREAQAS
jgi:hypothetical protein